MGPFRGILESGGTQPVSIQATVWTRMVLADLVMRRCFSRFFCGLKFLPSNRSEYNTYWDSFRHIVPKERLIEWDMKRHGWEDLCGIVKIANCSKQGLLPRANEGPSNTGVFNF